MAAVVQVKFVVSDAEGLAKLSNWKNQVQALGSGSAAPLAITGKGFSDFGREAERAGGLTNVFRESVHTLHPVLQAAGVEMGVFGGLARAAGGGVIALAAAAIGVAAVALARLGDQSIVARKRLSDVLGTAALGDKTFARLQERAKGSGTDVSALARPLEDLQAATKFGSPFRAVPGKEGALPGAQNINQQIDGLTALFQTMRTGAASEAEAAEGLAKFTGALRAQVEEGKKAQLTAQMVADLARVAPGAANALAQAFNRPDAQALEESLRKLPIAIDQLVPALARMAGAASAAFNDPAKHIKTFTDALGDVKHEFDNLVKSLTGDDLSGFMAKRMEEVKAGLQVDEKNIEALIAIWKKLKALGAAEPPHGVLAMIDAAQQRKSPASFDE